MRNNLKEARKNKNLTQKQVADFIGVSEVNYRQIESGKRLGVIDTWDKLEDLFSIHQRTLRENV